MIGSADGTPDTGTRPSWHALRLVEPSRLGPTAAWQRDDLVSRHGLLDRLAETGARVVLVTAPAGSGKTALLRQWAAADPRTVCWIGAAASMSDPVVFERALAQAIGDTLDAAPGANLRPALAGKAALRNLSRLFRAMAFDDRPLLLVLDDLQELADQAALDVIALLADRMPRGWTLALASRQAPRLPLPRWRSDSHILELGFGDLAFDRSECSAVLELLGLDPSGAAIDHILGRTEGWAAGVYLAGVSLKARGGETGSTGLAGDEEIIRTYIETQMLARLRPETEDMLVRTSIVDAVSGPLADAITGRSGSAARLYALSRNNQLVFPLDSQRRWFRYHPLLRDVLLRRLEDTRLGARAAHRRAASWYAAEGRLDDAIEQQLAAGGTAEAARLVGSAVPSAYRAGRLSAIRDWVGALGSEELAQRPQLAVMAAFTAALEGDPLGAMQWAAAATRGGDDDETAADRNDLDRSLVQAFLCRRGPEAMAHDADTALAAHDDDWAWRPTALLAAGAARGMLGERVGADARFIEAEQAPEIGSDIARFALRAERALAAIRARRWHDVDSILSTDRAAINADPDSGRMLGMLWLVADARLAIHRGDLRAATERIQGVEASLARLTWAIPWYSVRTLTELARAQLLLSDPDGAAASLAQAREISSVRPLTGNLSAAISEVAELTVSRRDGIAPRSALTPAELRLLPLLQTYLTFKEIGERLCISSNTVKTQAMSIYAKLGSASRSEAVTTAVSYGLLEDIFA
ncbi:MAG: AAA family ATPase [Chloroflexota bacterium]